MSDRDAFLANIVEDAASVAPRLVYSDWLEEQGDHDSAAFVREPFLGEECRHRTRAYRERLGRVKATVADLLLKKSYLYLGDGRDLRDGKSLVASMKDSHWIVSSADICAVVRHGFITEIGCCQKWFLAAAGALFRRHPITEVYLTAVRADDNIEPENGQPEPTDERRYYRAFAAAKRVRHHNGGMVHPELYSRLAGYAVLSDGGRHRWHNHEEWKCYLRVGDAMSALSVACVDYGRERANLPPLQRKGE